MKKHEANEQATEQTPSEPSAKTGKRLTLERTVVRGLGVKSKVRAGCPIEGEYSARR